MEIMGLFDDKPPRSLDDQIRVEVRRGSGKNERLINSNVSLDELNAFMHLSNLKSVEAHTVGKYICTFHSKMNFE